MGDGFSVHDDVFFDNIDVVNWVLKGVNNLVESSPVHLGGIDGLANWDGLLESLDESKGSNGSSNSFIKALVFVSLLKSFN